MHQPPIPTGCSLRANVSFCTYSWASTALPHCCDFAYFPLYRECCSQDLSAGKSSVHHQKLSSVKTSVTIPDRHSLLYEATMFAWTHLYFSIWLWLFTSHVCLPYHSVNCGRTETPTYTQARLHSQAAHVYTAGALYPKHEYLDSEYTGGAL